jgi:hypothetical protein
VCGGVGVESRNPKKTQNTQHEARSTLMICQPGDPYR